MNILVTDGENRAALAVTRSLGRLGHAVYVSGKSNCNLSAASKFCHKALCTPSPLYGMTSYTDVILEIINNNKIAVVFPITEESTYCINNIRGQVGGNVIIASPMNSQIEAIRNKYELYKLADRLGVDIPLTVYVDGAGHIDEAVEKLPSFPVVVKPAFSKTVDGDTVLAAGVAYADDKDQLMELYSTNPALKFPSVIQERIQGEGSGLFTLFSRDHHLALFSHRRLLEKPPSGGVSVLCESIPLDGVMVDAASKLLTSVGWTGVAMVEFKRDRRDGKPKLMEINGRFWGSLQLAIASGVDFPALCLEYYLHKNGLNPSAMYKTGHKLKWFLGLLDHLIIRLKNRNLFHDATLPSYGYVLHELFNVWGKDRSSDVFALDDLGPIMAETRAYVRSLLR
ncbi:carboxylate--amine ligase [Geomonas anaerohicana]|uniref:ATP-grasp domain-containing protein n=1 Tax=Geomonas anaerohicana TaxID=2798583 RepID=A0ABS0YC00_9BACT|nr:ATP-grasp domain-containing protein [Geomonas anaerohicana]MBJ6749827.1 ATP-grasp domain-containing protein [Geomonas anaerohicana]